MVSETTFKNKENRNAPICAVRTDGKGKGFYMNDYVLMTDSSADLPRALIEELGVQVLQLNVTMEGEEPRPNDQIDVKEFYHALRDKRSATTSTVSIESFLEAMEAVLQSGKDILYLGFSSGLSGTYNAGFVAAGELSEKYPERKIYTVDTLCASLGEGLLVYTVARMKK